MSALPALQQAVSFALEYQHLHLEDMKLLMERFVTQLREWDLIKSNDLEILFSNIDDVYAISQEMLLRLRGVSTQLAKNGESPDLSRTFLPDVLEIYREYSTKYPAAERVMMRCLQNYDQFGAFLNVQQRNTHTTLENLLRQPLECVSAYCEAIQKILNALDDRSVHLPPLQESLQGWKDLNVEIEAERKEKENEDKIAAIELSFINDDLRLCNKDGEEIAQMKQRARRRLSAPGALLKFMAQEAKQLSKSKTQTPSHVAYRDAQGEMDMKQGPRKRVFLREASMRILQGDDIRRRHLFLFNDQLLVAKPRSRGTFKLKIRFRFCHSWYCSTSNRGLPDDDRTFIVGGPHQRDVVFIAASVQEKEAWLEALQREIHESKLNADYSVGHVNVYPFIPAKMPRNDGHPVLETVETNIEECATSVIEKVLRQLGKPDFDPLKYCLWEMNRYGLAKLNAWECPLIITEVGARRAMHDRRFQFILRQVNGADLSVDMLPPNLKGAFPQLQSPRTRRKERKANGGLGFMKKVMGSRSPRSPHVAEMPDPTALLDIGLPKGRLYAKPLDAIITDSDKLPKPVEDMLYRLYFDGPSATGLFRKSANARVVRQVRERLDAGLEVDFREVPILAVGSVLKEFLRSLPDCLFPLKMYSDFVESNSLTDEQQRIQHIARLLEDVPHAHLVLLKALLPVLVRILEHEEENSMTARNLGICVGQSMMWPARAEDVLKNDVPPFIEFVISHARELFGTLDHTLYLRRRSEDPSADQTENGEEEDGDDQNGDKPRRISARSDDTLEDWDSDDMVSPLSSPSASPARMRSPRRKGEMTRYSSAPLSSTSGSHQPPPSSLAANAAAAGPPPSSADPGSQSSPEEGGLRYKPSLVLSREDEFEREFENEEGEESDTTMV
eukprot:m.39827 g.39827  ORF g.39827 m.39827 type:complete len:900 (-) comp5966_c0_seq1:54-2753(-)